ncbi:MAG: glycosyltransferase, partial [Candidatus Omnitrophica bacterium]|nr:glycosyltransferase [Candidatus Omnitrophota bacterium]
AFNYTNPISEKVINRLYLEVIKRTPQIWNYLYDNPSVVKNLEKIKASIHKFNSPKLKNLFEKFKPDAVLCSQAFPCGMCADYKKTYNVNTPLVAVLTDYVPHSFWLYDAVNYYITPSDDVTLRLMQKGVELSKIKSLGIPFDQKFIEPQDKEKLLQKLRLKPDALTILLMGGGQGLGPIKTIISSLEKINYPLQEIVVTGTNKKLYKSLKRKVKKLKKDIQLLSYSNNIHELMAASDLIISKPGGVTTAEVLAKKLPMIIVKPIPGQEENNTRYLTEKGAAIKIDEPEEINSVIEELIKDASKLKRLSESAGFISKPLASLNIAKLILELANA